MQNLEQVVLTTNDIIDGIEDITEIYYDDDGIWQALSEKSNLDFPKIISLKNLFEINSDIKDIIKSMKKGEKAIKKDSKWDITIDD